MLYNIKIFALKILLKKFLPACKLQNLAPEKYDKMLVDHPFLLL